MDGGEYKTQGADTCVYIPHVTCAGKSTTIRASDRGTEFVSRITRDAYEVKVQKAVVKALDAIARNGTGISHFFNLADSSCAPKFKPEDKKERCTVPDLQDNKGLINLVTPKQGDTLFRSILVKSKPDALIKSSLKGLMLAMVQLNAEKVTHSDSHFNNLGWIGDQLVIFDWGRGTVGLEPFKAWTRRYLAWNTARQEEWKNLSQHTLQFSLLDLYPVHLTQLSSKGLFSTIMSVWDTLGLLGPARAAGIVSEEKAKSFADEIFKSIREKPKQSLTEKLKVMIPTLFGDPPAIHPIVAEKPMPPAEAKAVSRIIPAESSVVEVKAAPAPAADPDKKKLEDMKDACRKLLAPGGGRRRTFRRKRHQKGGDYLDGGADTLVWNQKPTDAEKTEGMPWMGLPIGWDKGTLSIPPVFDNITEYGEADTSGNKGAVVRMILLDQGEMDVHRVLKSWASKDENAFVKMHLNTFIGGAPYTTHTSVVLKEIPGRVVPNDPIKKAYEDNVAKAELKLSAAKSPYDVTYWTKVTAALSHTYFPVMDVKDKIKVKDAVMAAGGSAKWYGLPTIRQSADLSKRTLFDALRALVNIAQSLVHVDGFWIQQDLHDGNMACMLDGTPVIHDYGRMKFRDYDLKELGATSATIPSSKNGNILRNIIPELISDIVTPDRNAYMKSFSQYYYVMELLDTLSFPPSPIPNNFKERVSWINIRLNESSGYKIKNRRRLVWDSLGESTRTAQLLSLVGSLFAADPQVVKDGGRMTETPISSFDFIKEMRKMRDLDEAEDAKKDVPPTHEEKRAAVVAEDWGKVKSIKAAIRAAKPTVTNRRAYLLSLYKDPVYETRYHHLARIWDLLSVMKVIANTAWDAAVDANKRGDPNTANYAHIRELGSATARMLMRNVAADSPLVGSSDLEKIVLKEFCTEIVETLKKITPIPDFIPVYLSDGRAVGKAYWAAVNLDRSGLKAPAAAAAAAAAPAAAPGGGARMRGGGEFDAEIKAEQEEDDRLAEARKARRQKKFEEEKEYFRDEEVTLDDIEISPSPERKASTDAAVAADIKAADAEFDAAMNAIDKPSSHVIQGGKLTRRRRLPRLY
jgi:hypothetical protein